MAAQKEEWPEGYAEANKGPEILIVTITLTTIALLFVAARIYSRRISMRKLAADDYIVIFCIVRPHSLPASARRTPSNSSSSSA